MSFSKITEEQIAAATVVGQDAVPGLSAREMQLALEGLPRQVLIPALNALVDALAAGSAAGSLGAMLESGSAGNVQDALDEKAPQSNTFTKAEVIEKIAEAEFPDSGTAANSLKLGGQLPAYYATAAGLAGEVTARQAAVADLTGKLTSATVTLTAAGWTGTDAPYTQSVNVSGMTAAWVPGVAVAVPPTSTTNDNLIALREALGLITTIESSAGKLTFVCAEDKPEVALTVKVPGVM